MARIPDWLKLPFEEALEYHTNKIALPAESLEQLMAEYHDLAFVVSGLTRADLTSDMQWLIERAIADGMSLEDFKRQFDRLISRKGWQPKGNKDARLRTIFDTNQRRSQAAGHFKRMREPEMVNRRPYWMWKWRDSVVPRPHHKALDGKVFLASEPFWEIAMCPCAYGCRCTVFALSERDIQRMGKTVEKPPDPKTIAEKGFQRAPGLNGDRDRFEILKEGLSRQSPTIRKLAEAELKKKGVL